MGTDSLRNRLNRPWVRTVGSVAVILLLALAAWTLTRNAKDVSWSFLPRISALDIFLIILYSALGSIVFVLASMTLIRGAGRKAKFKDCYLSLTASQGVNVILPLNLGIPARVYLYKRLIGIPVPLGTALIGIEAVAGTALTAFIAAWGFFFIMDSFSKALLAMALVFIALVVVGLALFFWRPSSDKAEFPGSGKKAVFRQRIGRFVGQVQTGLAGISKGSLALAVSLMFLNWLFTALRFNVVAHAMNLDLSIWLVLSLTCMSVTAGTLTLIPMGLGVRDVSLTLVLIAVGIARPQALSLALIQRIFNPGWPLLLGVISLYILGVKQLLMKGKQVEGGKEE